MLEIRLFKIEDLQEIREITELTLGESYPESFFQTISLHWPEGSLVATQKGKIVGFIMGVISGLRQARILMLAVKGECRHAGIASTLIRSFMSSCIVRSIDSIILEVRISNAEAINLYGKFGFRIVENLRSYYRDGEGGYRMHLVLQS